MNNTDLAARLDGAAIDMSYASRQLVLAAEYTRRGNLAAAQDAMSRACEGWGRAGAVLCPVPADDIVEAEAV